MMEAILLLERPKFWTNLDFPSAIGFKVIVFHVVFLLCLRYFVTYFSLLFFFHFVFYSLHIEFLLCLYVISDLISPLFV